MPINHEIEVEVMGAYRTIIVRPTEIGPADPSVGIREKFVENYEAEWPDGTELSPDEYGSIPEEHQEQIYDELNSLIDVDTRTY